MQQETFVVAAELESDVELVPYCDLRAGQRILWRGKRWTTVLRKSLLRFRHNKEQLAVELFLSHRPHKAHFVVARHFVWKEQEAE